MLTETLSGKCPCCGYDKLLQRYGSIGYLQLDGCSNCGFGYASNHHDDDVFGVNAWLPYGKYLYCLSISETDEDYNKNMSDLDVLPDEDVRKLVFEWCEMNERANDIDGTVFVYTEEDVDNHKSLELPIFKSRL